MSHNLHPPGSPLSPLSPPSPFQPSSSNIDSKTIYDVIYSTDNPTEFYGEQGHLSKTGACPHLVELKQKSKDLAAGGEENILENYRSLVRYSILWHKSRKSKAQASVAGSSNSSTQKKRKQLKEVINIIGFWMKQLF
jgi:ubiquitin carboxyl-terminal hydrolase 22/27/51